MPAIRCFHTIDCCPLEYKRTIFQYLSPDVFATCLLRWTSTDICQDKEENVWNDIKMKPNKLRVFFFYNKRYYCFCLFFVLLRYKKVELSKCLTMVHVKKCLFSSTGKNIISNKVYQALRHIPFIVRIPRKLVFNALSGCKLSF